MALDKDRLGLAIVTALQALNPNTLPEHTALMLPYWVAVSDEVIKEIQNNIDITVQVTGVQNGVGTATGTDTSVQ